MIRTTKYKEHFIKLLKVLEEQGTFSFTGKINILINDNNQYVGSIYQLEGSIINAKFKGKYGIKSFYNLFFEISTGGNYKFVAEPEEESFRIEVVELFNLVSSFIKETKESLKLRPMPEIKLMILGNFILDGKTIDSNDFEVLKAISDYSRVEDIYEHCQLLDYEITRALVSLRKCGALKVIS